MAPLLAETNINLPVSPSIVIAGVITLAMPLFISAFKGLLEIIGFFRAKPPLDEKYATKAELQSMRHVPPLHEVYATKEELLEAEQRLCKQLDGDGKDLDDVEERLTASRSEMEKRISDEIKEVKSAQATMEHSFQNELRSVGQQLGKVFGLLEGMTAGKRTH